MPDSRVLSTSIRRYLSVVFSFETAFVLYLFAGFYKASDYLAWMPVDLTLFFLIVSAATGGWVLWKRRFVFSRQSLALIGAMVIFSGWVSLSLLWAPSTRYGQEKVIQFAVLTGWALAGAALVLDGDRQRLTRFYGAILALAILMSMETMRVYLPHMDVRSYRVLGTTYQAVGRLVGLGFVVVAAVFLDHDNKRWKSGLFLVLGMLYFFVLLFVGARGPFIAATLGMILILFLSRGQFRRKLFFVAALVTIYLAGSLWMGQSLRTIHRLNVILAHEIGWELPGAQPTPVPTSSPTSTTVPTITPKSTPKSRIPTPKEASNSSVEQREKGIVNAWHLWLSSPLIGSGAGSFSYYYPANQLRVYPHNMILEILSEQGLVGIFLWTLIFVIAFWGFIKNGRWRKTLSIIALGFFTFTFINAMISGDIVSNRHLFTALGLLTATSGLWMEKT